MCETLENGPEIQMLLENEYLAGCPAVEMS